MPVGQQAYIGQRPTFISGINPILTADLWHWAAPGAAERRLRLEVHELGSGRTETLAMTSLYFFNRGGTGGSR